MSLIAALGAAAGVSAQTFGPPAALKTSATVDSADDRRPQVATNGAGAWVAVWETTNALGGSTGSDRDLLVARSADAGVTWSPPAALNSNASSDSGDDSRPRVAAGAGGAWVAVWHSTDSLGGTIGGDADILVSRSTDGGITWTAPAALDVNAASDAGNDTRPHVSTDGVGTWLAVWESTDSLGASIGSDFDLLVSRSTDAGATWTVPTALNTNAASDSGDDGRPQMATDGAGVWVAVWHSTDDLGGTIDTDFDILVSRSTDSGATWTAPAALNGNAAGDVGSDAFAELTTDGAVWIAVWRSTDTLLGTVGTDPDIVVSRSTDAGVSWTTPAALDPNAGSDSGSDFNPQVGTDGVGNWVAVWDSDDSLGSSVGIDRDVFVAVSSDGGASWTNGAPLDPNAGIDLGTDARPQLAADGAGNWVAVWESDDSLLGTIGMDQDVFVSRSTTAGAGWTAAAALGSDAATDREGVDDFPSLATDGSGTWVAAWRTTDSLGGTIGTDEDIVTSHSFDGGASWSQPFSLGSHPASDSGDDRQPEIATDGAGNWVAVWDSTDTLGGSIGVDFDILVARSSDGASWSSAAVLNTNAATDSGDDRLPEVKVDSSGAWVAIWRSDDEIGVGLGIDSDILVSRSVDAGASWTPPAALNTNAATDTGEDGGPQLDVDGSGNWVAVWHSNEPLGSLGSDFDILVSLSTDAGMTWTAPGPLNSNAGSDAGIDARPQLTHDGLGNWLAVWDSTDDLGATLGSDFDILVARSSDAGATWSTPLALNTNATTDTGADAFPALATDGAQNWLAVWESSDSLGSTVGTDFDILEARSTDVGATWSAPAPLHSNASSDVGFDVVPRLATDRVGIWVSAWESTDPLGAALGEDSDIVFVRGTGPDVDSDGLSDGAEVNLHGTDPFDADPDGDHLLDSLEVIHGTDPFDPDSDDDGYSDLWEVNGGSNPLDPASTPSIPAVGTAGKGALALLLLLTGMRLLPRSRRTIR